MRRLLIPLTATLLGACAAETFSPPSPDHFEVVSGGGQRGAPARVLDSLLVVRLVDRAGQPMPHQPVTWSIVAGGGSITPLGDSTAEDGTVSARWLTGPSVGTQSVRASVFDAPTIDIEATTAGLEAIDIAVARGAACAVTAGGAIWCWGDGGPGYFRSMGSDFGYGPRPVLVDSGHAFISIDAGDTHFCALNASGEIWCWGGYAFTLGRDASPTPDLTPAPVAGGHTWKAMAAADYGMLAIDDAGRIWDWGSTEEYENLLPGPPVQISPDSVVFTSIAAGYEHHCALEANGRGWCRGHADVGQLGDSVYTGTTVTIFRPMTTTVRFQQIAIGDHWTCGIDLADALWCWGYPPLGATSHPEWRVPQAMGVVRIGQLAATWDALLLNNGGLPEASSQTDFGQGFPLIEGLPSRTLIPVPAPASFITKMDVRAPTACFIRVDKQVFCAGEVPGYGVTGTPIGIPAP